jgi:hypothetical protein
MAFLSPVTIHSKLPESVALQRISYQISNFRGIWRIITIFLSRKVVRKWVLPRRTRFLGKVTGNKFYIYNQLQGLSIFTPLIFGRLETLENNQTVLQLRFRIPHDVLIFFIFWFGGMLFLLVATIIDSFTDPLNLLNTFIVAGVATIVGLLMHHSYKRQHQELIEHFTKILNCEDSTYRRLASGEAIGTPYRPRH